MSSVSAALARGLGETCRHEVLRGAGKVVEVAVDLALDVEEN